MASKKTVKSLKLSRETLRHMTVEQLRLAAAGYSGTSCGTTGTSVQCCFTL